MQFISKLFVIALILTSSVVSAQKKNILKLDISSPIMRTANVSFERILQGRTSFVFGALYTDQSDAITNSASLNRLAITPEYRYYMGRNNAPDGIYISVFARYQNLKVNEITYDTTSIYYYSSNKRSLNTGGLGISLGYQHIFQDKISIDLNFGTVWNSGDKRISTNDPYASAPNDAFLPYVGYFVRTGVAVGFLF
jgi:hypothetical protein